MWCGLAGRLPDELLWISPAEFELVVAGAAWREERARDAQVMLMFAVSHPGKNGPTIEGVLGRRVGESLVPGYETTRRP